MTSVPYRDYFLQAGCPSCRPTNSVKVLTALVYKGLDPEKISTKLCVCALYFKGN